MVLQVSPSVVDILLLSYETDANSGTEKTQSMDISDVLMIFVGILCKVWRKNSKKYLNICDFIVFQTKITAYLSDNWYHPVT
jgi:hypothetical protein